MRWLWLATLGLIFAIMPYTNRTSAIRYNDIQRRMWVPLKDGQLLTPEMRIRKTENGYEWRKTDDMDSFHR